MKKKSERIVNELFTLASSNEKIGDARLAAAIVHKGNIISYGFNKLRPNRLQLKFRENEHKCYTHAEIDAIWNAILLLHVDKLDKSDLYVVRSKMNEDEKFVFGLGKPCQGCMSCIKYYGIKRVFYTDDNGNVLEI